MNLTSYYATVEELIKCLMEKRCVVNYDRLSPYNYDSFRWLIEIREKMKESLLRNRYQIRKIMVNHIVPNTKKRVENTTRSKVFLTNFEVLEMWSNTVSNGCLLNRN